MGQGEGKGGGLTRVAQERSKCFSISGGVHSMQIAKRKSFLAFCTHFVFARTHTERERKRERGIEGREMAVTTSWPWTKLPRAIANALRYEY